MRLPLSAILFLSAILSCACEYDTQYPRPRRPERFDNAKQIADYIKELQGYYSVHGRGRYGKRQMYFGDAPVVPLYRNSPLLDPNSIDDPLDWKKSNYLST